jgi:hypothetical protein
MSVADDVVEPRWLQVPKWASATASGQRSAAQNGQDSSLTKTIAGLPPMVSGGPAAFTVCSGVAARPGLTRVSTPAGTVVTCLTTAEEASDSLAVAADAGPELSFTATSTPMIARTAVTAAIGTRNRRRVSTRF